MAIVLAHEIAHTLGLEEMYDNENYPNHAGNTGMQCIMELADVNYIDDLYNAIINNSNSDTERVSAFCPYCIAELTEAIPDDAYES